MHVGNCVAVLCALGSWLGHYSRWVNPDPEIGVSLQLGRRVSGTMEGEGGRTAFFGDLRSWIEQAPGIMQEGSTGLTELKKRLGLVMHMQAFDQLFKDYDTDGNDELELEEFTSVVRDELGIQSYKLSDDDLASLFHRVDKDGSGSIEANELRDYIHLEELKKRMRLFSFRTEWAASFRRFATDPSGGLLLPEFFCAARQGATSTKGVAPMSDQQLLEVFQRASGSWPVRHGSPPLHPGQWSVGHARCLPMHP